MRCQTGIRRCTNNRSLWTPRAVATRSLRTRSPSRRAPYTTGGARDLDREDVQPVLRLPLQVEVLGAVALERDELALVHRQTRVLDELREQRRRICRRHRDVVLSSPWWSQHGGATYGTSTAETSGGASSNTSAHARLPLHAKVDT